MFVGYASPADALVEVVVLPMALVLWSAQESGSSMSNAASTSASAASATRRGLELT